MMRGVIRGRALLGGRAAFTSYSYVGPAPRTLERLPERGHIRFLSSYGHQSNQQHGHRGGGRGGRGGGGRGNPRGRRRRGAIDGPQHFMALLKRAADLKHVKEIFRSIELADVGGVDCYHISAAMNAMVVVCEPHHRRRRGLRRQ